MDPPPVLDYATPPQNNLLRKTTAFILRILGCFYTLYAVTSVVAVFSSHRFADWLLLFLTVPTSIIFLGVNFTADHVVHRWAVIALIAVLINLGVALSCLGSAFVATPQEAPDGLIREFALCVFIPYQCLLIALALMLIFILRQTKARK